MNAHNMFVCNGLLQRGVATVQSTTPLGTPAHHTATISRQLIRCRRQTLASAVMGTRNDARATMTNRSMPAASREACCRTHPFV